MRIKSIGGGKPRLFELPPKPSSTAFDYLAQPSDFEACPDYSHDDTWGNEANNDVQCNTVPETSIDRDHERRCRELALNTTGRTVFVVEKSCGLGPQGMWELEDCLEMDWTEKEVCIKCDEGGNLLICSDCNCPLAVHEECMHCSARFDSMGNFYCPYCSYKRATIETRKARKKAMLAKKALSVFLDKGMMNGDPWKQKAERVWRKEPSPSTVVGDKEHDDTRNRLDGDAVDNHSVQIEENQREDRFDPGIRTSKYFCKCVEASAANEQNDNVRPNDSGQHKIVIEQQIHPEPVIASGGGGDCSSEEETDHRFEIVHVGKSARAEHAKLVDDRQNKRVVGSLSASSLEKETKLDGALHISTEEELDNAGIVEDKGRRREEEMQEQEQGTTVSFSGGDSMQQEHAKISDLSCGESGDVSPHWRRIKKRNQNVVQPPNVDRTRQSVRKLSSEAKTNVIHKEKRNATSKSRQRTPNLGFPNVKRKRLPWTAEEEEMLKEGVQKFSTMVNKNLPWRKILEFGHHVFDGTRTPDDLKDKWRKILVKECSTK